MKDKFTYIDLGLPSGRLWATENVEGYYTYNKAKKKFGELLPKPKAFQELWENCQWLWDVKKKGMIVVGPNKNIIFLPASGYRDYIYSNLAGVNIHGFYWLYSSNHQTNTYYYSHFYSSDVCLLDNSLRAGGFSVRLCKE